MRNSLINFKSQPPTKCKLNVQKVTLIKVRKELEFTFKINFYSKILKSNIVFSVAGINEICNYLLYTFSIFPKCS